MSWMRLHQYTVNEFLICRNDTGLHCVNQCHFHAKLLLIRSLCHNEQRVSRFGVIFRSICPRCCVDISKWVYMLVHSSAHNIMLTDSKHTTEACIFCMVCSPGYYPPQLFFALYSSCERRAYRSIRKAKWRWSLLYLFMKLLSRHWNRGSGCREWMLTRGSERRWVQSSSIHTLDSKACKEAQLYSKLLVLVKNVISNYYSEVLVWKRGLFKEGLLGGHSQSHIHEWVDNHLSYWMHLSLRWFVVST